MSETAIKVENLSRRRRVGRKEEMHDTLVGAIVSWVNAPHHNPKKQVLP